MDGDHHLGRRSSPFYLFAGRTLESNTARQLSWIAAAVAGVRRAPLRRRELVGRSFALIVAGIFAAIALVLLFGEQAEARPRAKS